MALQLLSQLVLPYAACTLREAGIAQFRAPPEHAAAGRDLVCQSRMYVRVALHWICVPAASSVSKSYAVDNPTLYYGPYCPTDAFGTYFSTYCIVDSVGIRGVPRIETLL